MQKSGQSGISHPKRIRRSPGSLQSRRKGSSGGREWGTETKKHKLCILGAQGRSYRRLTHAVDQSWIVRERRRDGMGKKRRGRKERKRKSRDTIPKVGAREREGEREGRKEGGEKRMLSCIPLRLNRAKRYLKSISFQRLLLALCRGGMVTRRARTPELSFGKPIPSLLRRS